MEIRFFLLLHYFVLIRNSTCSKQSPLWNETRPFKFDYAHSTTLFGGKLAFDVFNQFILLISLFLAF